MKKWLFLLFTPAIAGCIPVPIAPAPPPPAGVGYAQLGATATLAACFLPLINLGLITLIVAALVFAGKRWPRISDGSKERREDCLETVRQRYARGELTREEYHQMVRDLTKATE